MVVITTIIDINSIFVNINEVIAVRIYLFEFYLAGVYNSIIKKTNLQL